MMTQPFGTPYYIAPEVIRGVYTKKCDIWSAGIILYIMAIGKPPFDAKDNNMLLKQVLNSSAIGFENGRWKSRNIGLIQLVKQCIDPNMNTRISSELAQNHDFFVKFSIFNVEAEDIKNCLL